MPKEAPNRVKTIWDDLKEYTIDKDNVEDNFKIAEKAEEEQKIPIKKIEILAKKRILEPKRIQKIAIAIGKIPSAEIISKSIGKMDDNLSRDAIFGLVGIMLTEVELSQIDICLTEDPKVLFEKEETLLLKYEKIPNIKKKLEMWAFLFEYEDNMATHELTVQCMECALKEIKTSKLLVKILSLVLAIGNVLNGNTNKGRADGFNFDLLSKLSTLKDNNNKPLYAYIISILQKEDSSFVSLLKFFPNVSDSSKFSLADAFSFIVKAKRDVTKHLGILEKLDNDDFQRKIKEKLNKIKTESENYEKRLQDFNEDFKNMAINFGMTEKDKYMKNPEEFMALMNSVIMEFEKNFPKEEVKKNFNRTHKIGAKITDTSNTKEEQSNKTEKQLNVNNKQINIFDKVKLKEVKLEKAEIKSDNKNEKEKEKEKSEEGGANNINSIFNNLTKAEVKEKEPKDSKPSNNLANLIKMSLEKRSNNNTNNQG